MYSLLLPAHVCYLFVFLSRRRQLVSRSEQLEISYDIIPVTIQIARIILFSYICSFVLDCNVTLYTLQERAHNKLNNDNRISFVNLLSQLARDSEYLGELLQPKFTTWAYGIVNIYGGKMLFPLQIIPSVHSPQFFLLISYNNYYTFGRRGNKDGNVSCEKHPKLTKITQLIHVVTHIRCKSISSKFVCLHIATK